MFNKATNLFSIRSYSSNILKGIWVDALGRFVVTGGKDLNGYNTQFTPQSFPAHPDFQTIASWTMNALSSGTDDIVADSGQTIGVLTSRAVATPTYTDLIVTYVAVTSYTSDVNFRTSDQCISVIKNTTSQVTPTLSYSISGSTSITFSIGNYISAAPTWVTINSISGVLSITAPDVASETEYDFYIN